MAGKDKVLKKGELLFKEGDDSRSLYLIKSGIIKIFKTKIKGDQIELGVIKSNEILGEMAFFDGSPRSASAEAIQDSTAIEIDFNVLKKHIESQPEWFAGIIRSIVGRLRTANNRIKQLESSQVSVSYKKGASGQLESSFEYFSSKTITNFTLSLLSSQVNNVIDIPNLKKYYQYLYQENPTKLLELVTFFAEQKILDLNDFKEGSGVIKISNPSKLNSFIEFLASEAKKESELQFNITKNQALCLELIKTSLESKLPNVKYIQNEKKPNDPPELKVEVYAMISQAKENMNKTLILDNFTELKTNGVFQRDLEVVSPTEAYFVVDEKSFMDLYPNLQLQFELQKFNEAKTTKARGR